MATVGYRIGGITAGAQHPLVDAFPLQTPPLTMAPRRLLGGIAVAAAVLLSIWMVIAAGLQRGDLDSWPQPQPPIGVPAIVQSDVSVEAAEIAPAPGAAVTPMKGSLSPR